MPIILQNEIGFQISVIFAARDSCDGTGTTQLYILCQIEPKSTSEQKSVQLERRCKKNRE